MSLHESSICEVTRNKEKVRDSFSVAPQTAKVTAIARDKLLTFKRQIKSRLPFAGIIRSSPYSPRFQDKG